MKNFTNNFKQFTSRLSARWLIMALMLLLGTSSAWAAQFETNGTALSIKLNTSNDNYNYGLSGHDVTELNVVSGPIHIKETYIHVDKSIGGDFCGAELRIKDGDGDRKVGDFGWQSNDDNSRQTWKWSGDFEVKPITEGNHTFQIYVKGNFCDEDKYLSNGGSNYSFSYTIEATDPCATTYYLKHAGWSNGNWGWSDAMTCNDGIYTLEAKYNGSGCNYNTKKDDNGAGWIQTLNNPNEIQSGTLCIFTFDPSGPSPSITITPKCTTANFSVSLTNNGTVNKGEANIKASVSGTPSPAVTWSSSDSNIATIDANGNITAEKYGKVTITATTKGTDAYCSGTQQTAELTVRETPTITISGETKFCGESTTLTADISDLTATNTNGKTITWYKDGGASSVGTGATYNATATGIYTAKITGTYIKETTSDGFSVTKKATPTAANFTYEAPSNLTFSNSTKSATVGWNGTQGGDITVKYSSTSNKYTAATPKDVGTYYVFVSTVENDNYCAVTDLYINTFKIAKATQTALSISTDADVCGKSVTLATSGGTGTGTVTYSISGTNNIGASISGTTLSATSSGSVTVKATKSGGTNYNDATVEKTFNFTMPIENVKLDIIEGESATGKYCVGHQIKFQLTYTGSTPTFDTEHFSWILDNFESEISNNVGGIASGATWTTTLGANDTSLKLKLKDCNGSWKESTPITFEVYERPSAPVFNSNSITVCQGEAFTLPGSEGEGYIWSDALGKPTTANKPNGIDATTDYYAVISFGCPSDATLYTVNVNPLPTISITGNPSAVFYEDVVLTANATDGATVKWYEGGVEKATGATYVVTSETATSKAVTAKAFLNGCESDEASHTVKFSAEDCGNIGSNNSIIITCDPGTYTGDLYCYIFGATTPKGWSECKGTKNNGIWEWEFNNINEGDHSLIFHSNSKYDGKDCKTGNLNHKLQRGYQYDYALNGVNSNWCKEPHPTIDPVSGKKLQTISAPAVKTVSATSEEGSGIVTFTGKVLKTGCANGDAIWVGYQYKKANEAWPTTGVTEGSGVKQLVSISNNPGSEDFTVNVEGLENGNYHFRAYIINGYNFTNGNYDQGVYYGLDKLVTVSTTKTPISNVTLNYCDENGGNVGVDPNPMCKGAIAYVKLDYTGSKYSDIKWLVEGVETNLVTDEGDDVWSYEIQGDGSLSVELKNDANTDPAWPYSNKLPFEIIPEPTAPYISIDPASGIICEGSSATIKVENNPSPDCSYKLVKEGSEEEFPPYDSGDLTYTVQDVGKYYVIARHNECTAYEYTSNQVAINQIIRTNANISIDPAKAVTTPWEPVTITVKPDAGYTYELTYTDGNLAAVDGVRIKQNGDSYTYYIPRPDSWGTGDSDPVRDPINYGIKAQLKVDGEASECKLKDAPATIQLKDEDNENCPK